MKFERFAHAAAILILCASCASSTGLAPIPAVSDAPTPEYLAGLLRERAGVGNTVIVGGFGLASAADYQFRLYTVPSPSFNRPGSAKPYDEDFLIFEGNRAVGLVEILPPSSSSRQSETADYYRRFFKDCGPVQSAAVKYAGGRPSHMFAAQTVDAGTPRFVLLIHPDASSPGAVIQVNGDERIARDIFAGFGFHPEGVSRRETLSGARFHCTDGLWSWVGDIPGGYVLRHNDVRRTLIAVIGSAGDVELRSEAMRLNEPRRSSFFHAALIDGRVQRLECWLIAPSGKADNEKIHGVLMRLQSAQDTLSLLALFPSPPAFTPDGRLDEPAIEALLSTYLSFEDPGR
jgi:hypothetical protein